MADASEVIDALSVCSDQRNPAGYRFTSENECPYFKYKFDDGPGCVTRLIRDALDLLKAQEQLSKDNIVLNNGWIDANDRMPEENQDVLIYGYWRGRSGTVYKELNIACMKEFLCNENVPIAWMPLPDPPKEENAK